jgi:hypothetical protein
VKRGWKIAVAVAALITIVAALMLATDNSEPEYKGGSLSDWIYVYKYSHSETESREAAEALCEMFPTVLPTLVRWIGYEKSPGISRVEDFITPIANKLGVGKRYNLLIRRREHRIMAAFDVFQAIGTNATPAIPQLSNMVMDAEHPIAAFNALKAIAFIGKTGTPTIISLLHNPNNPYRRETLFALTLGHVPPEILMEEAQPYLTSSDVKMRETATNVLNDAIWRKSVQR